MPSQPTPEQQAAMLEEKVCQHAWQLIVFVLRRTDDSAGQPKAPDQLLLLWVCSVVCSPTQSMQST
jgi:hypothetical protein